MKLSIMLGKEYLGVYHASLTHNEDSTAFPEHLSSSFYTVYDM
jgi:hypothetical protein